MVFILCEVLRNVFYISPLFDKGEAPHVFGYLVGTDLVFFATSVFLYSFILYCADMFPVGKNILLILTGALPLCLTLAEIISPCGLIPCGSVLP